jgi:hypothetical protein
MQHHRAPTRLLDLTTSPYVAAYFACVEDWDIDGAIWLFHGHTFVRQVLADNSHNVNIVFPRRTSARMAAQQGYFMYSSDIMADHEPLLDAHLAAEQDSGAGETYRKVIVPKDLKPKLLRRLRVMNVTGASLFPGVDGLGMAARELARLSIAFP